jgi:hypothetical protein
MGIRATRASKEDHRTGRDRGKLAQDWRLYTFVNDENPLAMAHLKGLS